MEAPLRKSGTLAATFGAAFRSNRFLRFLIVGGMNTMLCYLVFAILVQVGLIFWAANFCALVFGILLSFFTQGRFVFGNRDMRRFGRFVLTWLLIFIAQTAFLAVLIRHGMPPAIAGLIVLPGTAIASYCVQRHFVFKRSSVEKPLPGGHA